MSKLLRKEQCPECLDSGRDNYAIYNDGSTYCFGCKYSVPATRKGGLVQSTDKTLLQPGEVRPLTKRRIGAKVCSAYSVTIKIHNGMPVVIFPHTKDGKVVAQKIKTPDKKIWWSGSPKDIDYFGKSLHNGNKKRLVITEGEEDCLAVYQTIDGYGHVTSLTNGANDVSKFITKHYESLVEYEQIVLCFDNDDAGREATKEFTKSFPVGKVAIAKYSEKDACDMLVAGKADELKWSILKAEVIRPSGVIAVGDLSLDYFKEATPKGIPIMFPKLSNALGGLRKGELTMLAGGPGMSKSTICTNMVYDFIVNKGLTIADIKLEEDQRVSIYNYIAMHTNTNPRSFRENPSIISDEDKNKFRLDFRNLYIHDHFGSLEGNNLLNILDYYATIVKVDYIFLDHISIAISGTESSREGERKDIDKLLTKIRELINRTKVGFVCVSHLSNPPRQEVQWEMGRRVKRSDLRGSGSLAQISDNIVAVEGNITNEATKNIRNIRLLKTRYGNVQETLCDSFMYELHTGRLVCGEFDLDEEEETDLDDGKKSFSDRL